MVRPRDLPDSVHYQKPPRPERVLPLGMVRVDHRLVGLAT